MPAQQKIYLGTDHGGYEHKEALKKYLVRKGFSCEDVGTFSAEDVDYPAYAFGVGKKVAAGKGKALGILLCRSGGGMTIAANKVAGIRAVDCMSVVAARHAKEHNNANVLVLSGDWLSRRQAIRLAQVFISTPFSNVARHKRRIAQITAFERKAKK